MELENLMRELLPEEAKLHQDYEGPARIIVPTIRTSLNADEGLDLKVIVLDSDPPLESEFRWRAMGSDREYESIPLMHVSRGVYHVTMPVNRVSEGDFEYYIRVKTASKKDIYFPTTAPARAQSVVVVDGDW